MDLTSSYFEKLPVNRWMNGDSYVRTTESFGILPIPEEQRTKLGMYPFNSQFTKDQKIRHQYLAEKQNTQLATLPIHTKPERLLFKAMLIGSQVAQREPNWENFARDWNAHCNQAEIYYKARLFIILVTVFHTQAESHQT